jgi:hypothetical protein
MRRDPARLEVLRLTDGRRGRKRSRDPQDLDEPASRFVLPSASGRTRRRKLSSVDQGPPILSWRRGQARSSLARACFASLVHQRDENGLKFSLALRRDQSSLETVWRATD